MRFDILTLFPELFPSVLSATMLQKGQERGALQFVLHNIRDYATDKHHVTDDTPYGGGQGMVMKPEPLVAAIEDAKKNGARLPTRVHVLSLAAPTNGWIKHCSNERVLLSQMMRILLLVNRER